MVWKICCVDVERKLGVFDLLIYSTKTICSFYCSKKNRLFSLRLSVEIYREFEVFKNAFFV
jgi:hypothetical protein